MLELYAQQLTAKFNIRVPTRGPIVTFGSRLTVSSPTIIRASGPH